MSSLVKASSLLTLGKLSFYIDENSNQYYGPIKNLLIHLASGRIEDN